MTTASWQSETGSALTHLECTNCFEVFDADVPHGLCSSCGKVLYSRYDLDSVVVTPEEIVRREPTMWRYRELLPVRRTENVVSLDEGFTPLLRVPRLAAALGIADLRVKDEGQNPTASFKARGMAAAVSRARELGIASVATPSAGNAAGALAIYAARAGLRAGVVMPSDCHRISQVEAALCGAETWLVDGAIDDAGRLVKASAGGRGWFDMSALKEPYRVEGKKTLGYELAEQSGFELPDVLVWPTGAGTGLVGMWKSFDEMDALGWIGGERPRVVVVQAEGCAPLVRAHAEDAQFAPHWTNAATGASGLRVPATVGDYLVLDAVRASGGVALTVAEREMREATREMASTEGIFASPESAATFAALRRLRESGTVSADESVVLFNTAAGQKHPDFVPVTTEVVPPGSPAWREGL